MTRRLGRGLQFAAASVLLVAYTATTHYCNTHGIRGPGAVLALSPLMLLALSLLWRSLDPWSAGALTLMAALVLYHEWPQIEKKFSMVYLLQECGMYSLLAAGFANSLRPGHTALCTRFADRLHGPLTPAELRYTRQVTAAWAIFFTVMAVIVLTLYLYVPMEVWSLFVNFVALPLIALMFVIEYTVRGRVLPDTERRGIWASVQIFFASR